MPVSQEELASRLRAAREATHLRQEDVAVHLGISRPAVAQIEAGKRSVTSLELDKLAFLYGRDIREFFADEFREEDTLVALFRRHPEVLQEDDVQSVLQEAIALGRELANLESLLGIERDRAALPAYPVRLPETKWEAVQQGERVAVEERRRLGFGSAPLPNVAELLESQGMRTAQIDLPEDISGLTLFDEQVGPFVVVNKREPGHSRVRRRFSYAHEYCHVLLDRDQSGTISRRSESGQHFEVRANAFAAAFLMPRPGVEGFVHRLGKGRESRLQSEVYNGEEAQRVQARPEPGSQEIQLFDVVLLAHHFSVSRLAALYRLKNLRLLGAAEFDVLKQQDEEGLGGALAVLLELPEPDAEASRNEFKHRFIGLTLEAFRRGEITMGKLRELTDMVEVSEEGLAEVLERSGLGKEEDGDGPGPER